MTHTLVISGGGRYSDPWHPFAKTTREMASLLRSEEHDVAIDDDPDEALRGLAERSRRPDLLVLNIGNPADGTPPEGTASGLLAYLEAGLPLLALHSSATAFSQWHAWEDILGGRWIRGTSMHPNQELCRVRISQIQHPITEGQSNFDVFDERYCYLRTGPVFVLAEHDYQEQKHSLIWTNRYGSANVVYDSLGHDQRSYMAEGHIELLRRSIAWLLDVS